METIHTRIKKRREEMGMSMKDLAEKVGVSAWQTVQQWEKEGGTAPKRSRLEDVAKALHTSTHYLTSGEIAHNLFSALSATLGEIEVRVQAEKELRRNELTDEAVKVGHAYQSLATKDQRQAIISLLRALGAWEWGDAEN